MIPRFLCTYVRIRKGGDYDRARTLGLPRATGLGGLKHRALCRTNYRRIIENRNQNLSKPTTENHLGD